MMEETALLNGVVGEIPTKNFYLGDANTLASITSGEYNIAIGAGAGNSVEDGNNNILIGRDAGHDLVGGDKNAILGHQAGFSLSTGSANVLLGYRAGLYHTTESDILLVDNAIRADKAGEIANALIYGYFENHASGPAVNINGTLTITTTITCTDLIANDDVTVGENIIHQGDADTYIAFSTNGIALKTGGNTSIGMTGTNIELGASDGGHFVNISQTTGQLTLRSNARVVNDIVIGSGSFHKGVSAPDNVYLGNNVHVLAFDKDIVEHGHYSTLIPMAFAAGTEISIEVDWAFADVEADHYVTWVMEYLLITNGEDPAGAITRTVQTSVVSTGNNDKQIHTTFSTGIAGAIADDVLVIRFFRDSDASYGIDDLAQDACLLAIHLHIIEDKLGDPV